MPNDERNSDLQLISQKSLKVFSNEELDKLEDDIANVSLDDKSPFVELQQP